jgi:predicted kinase
MLAVIVNGLPGSGKSTLAPRLAETLGLPLFAKDMVKETLADVLGVEPPAGVDAPAWSRRLGAATITTIWTMLGTSVHGAVVESPFLAPARPFASAGLTRAGVVLDDVHEVWCDVPPAVAMSRYLERAPVRHPIHLDHLDKSRQWVEWMATAEPLGFGTVYRVDTSTPVPEEVVGAVAAAIRTASALSARGEGTPNRPRSAIVDG